MILSKPFEPLVFHFLPIYNLGKGLSRLVSLKLKLGVTYSRTIWNAFQICRFLDLSLDVKEGGNLKNCLFHVLPK